MYVKNRDKLWNKLNKIKRFHKFPNGSVLLIFPSSWVRTMHWHKDMIFMMSLDTLNEQVLIKPVKDISQYDVKGDRKHQLEEANIVNAE